MKYNIILDTECDSSVDDIKYEIIRQAATQMLKEVMRNQDHYGRSFRDALRDEIKSILSANFDVSDKNEIKELVAKDIKNKYIKTKQYKELKEEFGIVSDKDISSGLRAMISDVVKDEIKKYFTR